ncbi:MAG: anaerobic ribonucleoside-triphosphate reductase activating protein [Paludibacteraceae bacterium]
MLKYADYDIVFREIPDEVTLAINLSNCPHKCAGCHSPHLREDIGELLSPTALTELLSRYSAAVTCVCFMGGDANPNEVCLMADFVRKTSGNKLKTAWYSGFNTLKKNKYSRSFDYIKLGEYIEQLGALDKKTTNQRLYKIENGYLKNITQQLQNTI